MLSFKKKASDSPQKCKSTFGSDALEHPAIECPKKAAREDLRGPLPFVKVRRVAATGQMTKKSLWDSVVSFFESWANSTALPLPEPSAS